MMRSGVVLILSLLTACAVQQNDGPQTEATPTESLAPLASGVVCRSGPDGGPVVADRGIGGTGAPQVADRGIGGTGVVGIITGFASVCVDGLEIRYDKSALVDIDGTAASVATLRAGQVVVIQASGPTAYPVAKTILVRREVVGRIESMELDSGLLTISGQSVVVPAGTWGAGSVRLGDWVAVSGLRRSDETIVASRFDTAPAGRFMVQGTLVRDGGIARVGQLELSSTLAASLTAGQSVTVSGTRVAGRDAVGTVIPDALFANPTTYFGSSVNHLVLQAFVHVARGSVWLNGLKTDAAPGVGGEGSSDGVAVVSLERKPNGSFVAVGLRYADDRGGSAASAKGSPGITRNDPLLTPQGRRAVGTVPTPSAVTSSPPAVGGQPVPTSISPVSGSPASAGPASTGPASTGPASGSPVSTGNDGAPSGNSDAITAPASGSASAPEPLSVGARASAPSGTGGATIESVSPQPPSPTSELISSNQPSPASPSKGAGAQQPTVVLVSGSASSPTVGPATGSTVPATTSPRAATAIAVSVAKGKVIGTSLGKKSPISPIRSNEH